MLLRHPQMAAPRSMPAIRFERPPEQLIRRTAEFEPEIPRQQRRSKIWELSESLHCSIIGTCLSTAELRNVLTRIGLTSAATADEHDLHVSGVVMAGHRESGAKLLQKALDRRHALEIKQFGKADDQAALLALWKEFRQRGDIPGAYWALLTHPMTNQDVAKKAFQDIHMLSHLVGAANRADIRRLCQLEEENGALAAKLERQQRQIRDGFTERDETIRRLNDVLATQLNTPADTQAAAGDRSDSDALRLLVRDLEDRLSVEIARRERAERRTETLTASLSEKERLVRDLGQECTALRHELEIAEDEFNSSTNADAQRATNAQDLGGASVLYVGGRANQMPQFRSLVERCNAVFIEHDGGVDNNPALLPSLVGRADIVAFPVDCISHSAVATIKRLCRRHDKRYIPLRTSSMASLTAALRSFADRTAAHASAQAVGSGDSR